MWKINLTRNKTLLHSYHDQGYIMKQEVGN